uniref:30S ribosomal protein S2 n=1 Tax=Marophrys sp. SRT127 TaxID=2488311 RepID=A0A455RET7_9EUKA|nr:30S ribosomal protein S2 [Marophrys sp. SRT127]
MAVTFLIKHFLTSAVHLGHRVNKWNPKTASFLFATTKNNIHLVDLEQSILMIRRASNFVKKVYENRGHLLYIPPRSFPHQQRLRRLFLKGGVVAAEDPQGKPTRGIPFEHSLRESRFRDTSAAGNLLLHPREAFEDLWAKPEKQHQAAKSPRATATSGSNDSVFLGARLPIASNPSWFATSSAKTSRYAGEHMDPAHPCSSSDPLYFLNQQIQGTSRGTAQGRIQDQHQQQIATSKTKKQTGSSTKRISEVLTKKRKERQFIPEVLFILRLRIGLGGDVVDGDPLVREAVKLQIPIIGIIDSNVNPHGIQYPIPGNDDSTESLSLYTQLILNAITEARKKELKNLFASSSPASLSSLSSTASSPAATTIRRNDSSTASSSIRRNPPQQGRSRSARP